MKITRLQHILKKVQEQFPDADLEFADGYLQANLKETPTQEAIDAVPTADYEEYIPQKDKYEYRMLQIFGDDA